MQITGSYLAAYMSIVLISISAVLVLVVKELLFI